MQQQRHQGMVLTHNKRTVRRCLVPKSIIQRTIETAAAVNRETDNVQDAKAMG